MSLAETTVARINELIAAVQAATAGSLDDADELAEVVSILTDAKTEKLAAVTHDARFYIFQNIRRVVMQNPAVPLVDVRATVHDVCLALASSGILLDDVLAGTVTE